MSKEAKDKAEELIEKYRKIFRYTSPRAMIYESKQCALICVDEIIIAVSMCYSDETVINYWKQVKQEILNRQ